MRVLTVGQPFNPAIHSYEQLTHYNYDAGGHELLLIYSHLAPDEIEAVRTGPVEFGLYVYSDIIFLCYQFSLRGQLLLRGEAPYSIHLVNESTRRLPPYPLSEKANRALLKLILVEARTGLVQAIRAVTFSPEFSSALHQAINQQAATPFNEKGYEFHLSHVYAFYNSFDLMNKAKERGLVCHGGD